MNRKIEALLIIASIGGGFTGVSIVSEELLKVSYFTLGHFIIFGSALTLCGYFIYAGLIFASNNENNKHLKITFLLQIPWVSSPILVYKIAAGFSISGLFHAGGFNFLYNLGSDFNFGIFNGQPWGVGINVAGVGLYYLASNHVATAPNQSQQSSTSGD